MRVLDRIGCVGARDHRYDGHEPIDALVHVAALCSACRSPHATYRAVNASRRPTHAPRLTAQCGGHRERNGAQKRHMSARDHSVKPLNALLLAKGANARGGATFFSRHGAAKLLIKKPRSFLFTLLLYQKRLETLSATGLIHCTVHPKTGMKHSGILALAARAWRSAFPCMR